MLTKEQRAEISRQNGAKSKGPVTPEGKDRSRRNAITHGDRSELLKYFVPPHSACLVNEERQEFYRLVDSHIALYQPIGAIEYEIVREIVDATWIIMRFTNIQSHLWSIELVRQPELGPSGLQEFAYIETVVGAAESLAAKKDKPLRMCERNIDRLTNHIAKCERRLKRIRRDFQSRDHEIATSHHDRAMFHCPLPEPELAERTCAAEPQHGPQLIENEADQLRNPAAKPEKIAAAEPGDSSSIRKSYPQFFPAGEPRFPANAQQGSKSTAKQRPDNRAA